LGQTPLNLTQTKANDRTLAIIAVESIFSKRPNCDKCQEVIGCWTINCVADLHQPAGRKRSSATATPQRQEGGTQGREIVPF
jgi:hypothetical protein